MTMPNPNNPPAQVYAAAYTTYWQAGWPSILPLPPRAKKYPPEGWTGNHGATPSYPDLHAWAEDQPDANIALRLPETVVGIDVDNYGTKTGGQTLQALENTWGPLPPTWRSTSRDDGTSGIRLYRAPAGLKWPSIAGGSIEIIRHAHRYAIVWPSTHPDTGNTYRWINPDGAVTISEVPAPDDLPLLPTTWIDGLTQGRQQGEHRPQADLTDTQARQWLNARPQGAPCPAVEHVITRRARDLTTPGTTRHDVMLEATQRLAHLAAEGHQGIPTALNTLRDTFLAQVADGSRAHGEAEHEWNRALAGAIRNAAPNTTGGPDPCTNPLHGLIPPESPEQQLRNATSTAPAPAEPPAENMPADIPAGLESVSETGSAADQSDDTEQDPPPSWRPIDLTPYLDGTWTPDQPTLLQRSDGHHLLYPGKVHSLHGESESGKSLVAQAETTTRIINDDQVLYIDFEDDAGPVTNRLLNMGATPTQIEQNLTYIRPETSPYAIAEAPEWANLLTQRFDLVILDGVTDALVQFGAGTKENDDITTWHRAVPRMLARKTGAAVVLIDHVIKNGDTRGRFAIGGQAKMAALDGAAYSVEVTKPIGKGMAGTITLRIGKDRPGQIRAHCGQWRSSDRTQEAANIHIDSTAGDNTIRIEVGPPTTHVTDTNDGTSTFRPTGVMEKISRLLEATREPLSFRQLEQAYRDDGGKAKRQTFADAVNLLADEGHLSEQPGPRGARMFRSAAVYRQHTDPESDAYKDPLDGLVTPENPTVPHRPPTVPRDGETTVPHHRPPVRDGGDGHGPNTTQPSPTKPGDTHPGPDWRLDYSIGEYVHTTTGEIWERP